MKKKQIIILVTAVILVVAVIMVILLMNNTSDDKVNWIEGEEYLYTKAINYVVEDTKKTSNYKDKEDYQVFTDYLMYGIEKQGTKRYVYMWILDEEYYVEDDKLMAGDGASMPYKFTFENDKIIECETPRDGSEYESSIREMYPDDIENLPLEDSSVCNSVQPQVKSYYSYLPSTEIHYISNEDNL